MISIYWHKIILLRDQPNNHQLNHLLNHLLSRLFSLLLTHLIHRQSLLCNLPDYPQCNLLDNLPHNLLDSLLDSQLGNHLVSQQGYPHLNQLLYPLWFRHRNLLYNLHHSLLDLHPVPQCNHPDSPQINHQLRLLIHLPNPLGAQVGNLVDSPLDNHRDNLPPNLPTLVGSLRRPQVHSLPVNLRSAHPCQLAVLRGSPLAQHLNPHLIPLTLHPNLSAVRPASLLGFPLPHRVILLANQLVTQLLPLRGQHQVLPLDQHFLINLKKKDFPKF